LVTVALLEAPVSIVTRRDAGWLATLIAAAHEVGWFANTPALQQRALLVADEFRQVCDNERQSAPRWLPVKEAAVVIGRSPRTIQRQAQAGVLESRKVGGMWRVQVDD
jgi:hypothetical protein